MKLTLLMLAGLVFSISGCSMFTAWKSIPPPGGCDQCHSVEISANWQVKYQVASIPDERGRLDFQTPEYNRTHQEGGQDSPLQIRKIEEKACFDCHKSPTPAHRERKGRFHH